MTGFEVRALRRALSDMTGERVSQRKLGVALGLSAANADRTVRNWEENAPSGPASVALTYLAQGVLDDVMKNVVPEFLSASPLGAENGDLEFVVRLWWPRFIGVVLSAEITPPGAWAWVEPEVERLALLVAIDDAAAFGGDWEPFLRRGASAFQIHTLDAL